MMSGVSLTLLVAVIIVIAINLKATLVLILSSFYDVKQKLFQLVLIWLLPVLGAIFVLSLAKDIPTERATTNLKNDNEIGDGSSGLGSHFSEGHAGDGSGD